MNTSNKTALYDLREANASIEVRLEDDTVWLSQAQMATLFNQTKQNISLHINNCYREGELEKATTVKNSLTVQIEGSRTVRRQLEYYNLDVIISVGYRVKSKEGTRFRIWATNVLRDFLLKGFVMHRRVERLEIDYSDLSKEVKELAKALRAEGLPKQGVFFDGQIFDAHVFVSNLIRRAKNSVVLIDNYIDESVLTLLMKRQESAEATIYTKQISKQLRLDVEKHNVQYKPITVKTFGASHDRFIIIDHTELYHMGASLKDLGKRWFAFSQLDLPVELILSRLNGGAL